LKHKKRRRKRIEYKGFQSKEEAKKPGMFRDYEYLVLFQLWRKPIVGEVAIDFQGYLFDVCVE